MRGGVLGSDESCLILCRKRWIDENFHSLGSSFVGKKSYSALFSPPDFTVWANDG